MNEIIYNIIFDQIFLWSFTAHLFYVYTVWKTRNDIEPKKPIRITWFMFLTLDAFIIINELANGKSLSDLGLLIGYTCGAFLVLSISIPYGTWINSDTKETGWRRFKNELRILILVIISLNVFFFVSEKISIFLLAVTLLTAAYPMIKRVWKNPQSEPGFPCIMWMVAAAMGIHTLGPLHSWATVGTVMPITYLGLNLITTWSIGNRKRV